MTDNETGSDSTTLIPCTACGKEISADADTCPGCGNVNNWVHPTLEKVIAHLDRQNRVTMFEAHGHRMYIRCEAPSLRQDIGNAALVGSVILLPIGLFAPTFLSLSFLLLTIGGALTLFGADASRTYELELDLRKPRKVVGRCDETFWADVLRLVRS